MKKKTNPIKLTGVQPDKIDKQYGFRPLNHSVAYTSETNIPEETTKIMDLDTLCSQNIIRTDDLKNNHLNRISIIDTNGLKPINCFWDRHPFSGPGIYCPIDKKLTPNIKEYISYINGKTYKIQDSLNMDDEKKTYSIDSIFCSTECCLAYLEDNKHNYIYQNSLLYLLEIYPNIQEKKTAPHWRLLQPYGGPLTIEKFRESFSNITFTNNGILFNPISFLFVETYHL